MRILGNVLSVDEHRNVLLDCSGKTEQVSEEVLEAIIAGFEYACRDGPLCGEPMRHVKVNLVDFQLGEDQAGGSEIMHGVGKAVFGSFLTADPVLLEPIYKIIITVASELVGRMLKNPDHQTWESHFVRAERAPHRHQRLHSGR